ILLVGPTSEPDPELFNLPRVQHHPAVNLVQLAAIGQWADVLIMPYRDMEVTRAMQPLKLLEYLATGKPVVARDLPATRDWSDCLTLAASPLKFSRAVFDSLTNGISVRQRQSRARLAEHSWKE